MATPHVEFVPLTEQHIAQIVALENRVETAPWSEQSFRNELGHAHSVFKVMMEGGQVIGFIGLWLLVDEAHITTVVVAPEHQRKGLGELLMRTVLREARERGMKNATLEVRVSNEPAIQLYKKLGFEEVAVRKNYYPENREDAVVMWLYRLEERDL